MCTIRYSNITDLYPPDASAMPPSKMAINMSPYITKCPLGGQNQPHLKTTTSDQQAPNATTGFCFLWE